MPTSKMNLGEAFKIALKKANSKTQKHAWDYRKSKCIKCKVSICKAMECSFLEYELQKNRPRSICGKTGEQVSNLYLHKMECQREWVRKELKM